MFRKITIAFAAVAALALVAARPAQAATFKIHASFSGTIAAEGKTCYVSGMVYTYNGTTYSSMGYQDTTGFKIVAKKMSDWDISADYAKFTADIVFNTKPRVFVTEVWLKGGINNAISMSMWTPEGVKKWGFDATGILLKLSP